MIAGIQRLYWTLQYCPRQYFGQFVFGERIKITQF